MKPGAKLPHDTHVRFQTIFTEKDFEGWTLGQTVNGEGGPRPDEADPKGASKAIDGVA
jgi:hypothetical protein